jgi:3-hydroxybutyryl-CoA dehydrogenase
MGVGVAQVFAEGGYRVILVDVTESVLDSALERVRSDLRLGKLLGRVKGDAIEDVLGRIQRTTRLDALGEADFVVENVTEDRGVKCRLFGQLDRACPADCVLASNTSAIPIRVLAEVTGRADKVLGLHFMNPAPLKRTVEMIRSPHTSDATIQTATALLESVGREAVVVRDSPGFVTNRILMWTINEAICLIEEGVADAEQIDRLFRECFGHEMGPLATADLIGLDTILNSVRVLTDEYGADRYRASPLLERLVADGRLGRKAGRGFYTYDRVH